MSAVTTITAIMLDSVLVAFPTCLSSFSEFGGWGGYCHPQSVDEEVGLLE